MPSLQKYLADFFSRYIIQKTIQARVTTHLKFGDGDGPNLFRVKKVDISSTFIENIFRSELTLESSWDYFCHVFHMIEQVSRVQLWIRHAPIYLKGHHCDSPLQEIRWTGNGIPGQSWCGHICLNSYWHRYSTTVYISHFFVQGNTIFEV